MSYKDEYRARLEIGKNPNCDGELLRGYACRITIESAGLNNDQMEKIMELFQETGPYISAVKNVDVYNFLYVIF